MVTDIKMETVIRIQISEEAVCISHRANAHEERINQSIWLIIWLISKEELPV